MISKVFPGHSFYHAVHYVCKEERKAEILATEGVREHDYRLMTQDFITQHGLRPTKKQACFHSVLSFYPGENPNNDTLAAIAKKYLEGIGITNTQYAIVKHTDKAHLHLHVFANMVNNEGRSIPDNWIALKGKKMAQQLTREYKLVPALRKELALTNLEALSESEANKYKVYMAIAENLPHCRTMEELEQRLLKLGIETQYKYKGQSQEKQGVSFKIGQDCFKGSKVDRQFSLGNLQKTLSQQQKQVLAVNHEQAVSADPAGKSTGQTIARKRRIESWKEGHSTKALGENDLAKSLGNALDILLKPEENYDENAVDEFLKEQRRHRKKHKKRIKR